MTKKKDDKPGKVIPIASARVYKAAANLPKGTGATRSGKKLVKVYSPQKTGKTHGMKKLMEMGAALIATDPNCISTLEQIGALPPPELIYEPTSLTETMEILNKLLDAAEENAKANPKADFPLGIPALIFDSDTAVAEWHQSDVANETGQRFLGETKGGGWQKFNADFGRLVDRLAEVARYTNVVIIGHSKEKANADEGEGKASFMLPPAMALKVGRTVNWILYQTVDTTSWKEGDEILEGVDEIREDRIGKIRVRRLYRTIPYQGFAASAPQNLFQPSEPVDLAAMLIKAGAL